MAGVATRSVAGEGLAGHTLTRFASRTDLSYGAGEVDGVVLCEAEGAVTTTRT